MSFASSARDCTERCRHMENHAAPAPAEVRQRLVAGGVKRRNHEGPILSEQLPFRGGSVMKQRIANHIALNEVVGRRKRSVLNLRRAESRSGSRLARMCPCRRTNIYRIRASAR